MSEKRSLKKAFMDAFHIGNRVSNAEKNISPYKEAGVIGAKISGGYVYDDFIRKLLLEQGRRTYREMSDNNATIGSILFAIEMIIRAVDWLVEENEETKGTPEAEEAKEFVKSVLFEDMDHTWDEFITEVLSMLVYGWEYTEVVFKKRFGPHRRDENKSNYSDGKIGIKKLANRPQETLDKWDMDEYGNIYGMFQTPPMGGQTRYIPYWKALLFRPHCVKGSPEGRSVLRRAYESWFRLKNIQQIEAIAIERELNGLPVVEMPDAILNGTSKEAKQARAAWVKVMRDIKFNEQGGLGIPSDPWYDSEGQVTQHKKYNVRLMASEGHRAIDTDKVILRYQRDIARVVLADFIMLGSDKSGSFALSKDKSSFFTHAVEGWLKVITETINRRLIPMLWELNSMDAKYMPKLTTGRVSPVNLDELGKYISDLAGSGMPLFPDEGLEEELRNLADLPQKEGDAISDFDIKEPGGSGIVSDDEDLPE